MTKMLQALCSSIVVRTSLETPSMANLEGIKLLAVAVDIFNLNYTGSEFFELFSQFNTRA